MATVAKNLKELYIRKNAVLLKCDWKKCENWTQEFYNWLKLTSRSYDRTEAEVSRILNKRWKLLTDRQYRQISKNYNLP